jgi:tetraacyldisaccharide 4'-kinase
LLDFLYARAAAARRRWYERYPHQRRHLERPVISVGNLSVGGTGKTPMVAVIAQWLIDRGERPAILSRGYGRRDRLDGVVVVSDGRRIVASLDAAGDEPLMLAHKVRGAIVTVAEDRFLAGILAERKLGATVHVLDDGFQHVQLARDLDVLMTMPGEISGGRVVPFGRLREARDAAARADLVVVLDTDLSGARAEAWALGVSQAAAGTRVLDGRPDVTGLVDADVVAVAGIARPDQFFQLLRDNGYRVVESIAFPDHHRYSTNDIARVAKAAQAVQAAAVVTTEKDLVRLEALGSLPFECIAVPLQLALEPWETIAALITEALARAREAA